MKKKIKLFILGVLCCICLIGRTNAATLAVGNDTTEAGATNKSVSIELRDDDLSEYTKVEFQLTVSGTSYATINYNVKVSGLSFGNNGEGTYTIGDGTSNLFATSIGTVSYTTTENLAGDFKIVPTNVKFYKADGSEYKPKSSEIIAGNIKYQKQKSNDSSLVNLTVSQGSLTPAFDKGVFEYTVVVKDTINTIRINADATASATRIGAGTKSLAMGENNFEIVVTAEDGETKSTYKIKVIRGEISEPSAYLSKLDINNIGVALSPEFDPKNNKYTIRVTPDISKLDLKYEAEDPLAEVTIDGNEKFTTGENKITITVKASDESDTQVYELSVIQDAEESTESTVVVEKQDDETEEKKSNKTLLIVIIVIVVLLVVGGVAFVLFRKKKNTKKENEKLPLRKRVRDEDSDIRKRETSPYTYDDEENVNDSENESSITQILKDELYENTNEHELSRTQKFDRELLKKYQYEDDEDIDDKTKEFNFKDFQ